MLTSHESLLIAIIAALFVLIFATRLKIELIAILILLTLRFTGLVTSQQALSGFSSTVVVTLIGLFVITRALEDTGVVQWIAGRLNTIGEGSEIKLVTLFMMTGAALSLIMNNVAAGAVLLPAAVQVAHLSDIRVSKLLMPMSFGTLVGGMATYLTTANIVMSELLKNQGINGLGMVDFIPTGGVIVIAALVYMLLIGRRLLPERETLTQTLARLNLSDTYQLDERLWKIRVTGRSELAYKSLADSGIGEKLGLTILAVQHGRHVISAPGPAQMLYPSDIVYVIGRKERVDALLQWGNDLLDEPNGHAQRLGFPLDPAEIVVAPRSNMIGQTLADLHFRNQFGVTALALWREGRSYRTDVNKMPLQVGDALLVIGKPDDIQGLLHNRNYIIPEYGYSPLVRYDKAWIALLITAVVLCMAILDLLPLPEVMLAGAVTMVLTGCLNMEEFFEAIEWRVIFLIVGMLPLSIAIADTGLADRVSTALIDLLADTNSLVLIAGITLLTMSVVQVIGGQVTALLVGPIAITTALQMDISPRAMAVAVAIACSMAFLTPIAHPVNVLMMGPGGYKFSDFFKVGFGMTVVTLLALLFGLVVFWGIH